MGQDRERPTPGEEPIRLDEWLEERIAAHSDFVLQRRTRGDRWFLEALHHWDVRNTHELLTKVAPDLVDSYRGKPSGHIPGAEHEQAYFDRQLTWLKTTLRTLRDRSPERQAQRAQNRAIRNMAVQLSSPEMQSAHEGAQQALHRLPATRLADPAASIAEEIVTPESIERELNGFAQTAGQLLQGDVTDDGVDDWSAKAGITIRIRGPEGEEDMFLATGDTLAPRARLEAKVARIQNHILPKVRAGEWTR